jgi:tetratricopeptide (TPR) repeat protein
MTPAIRIRTGIRWSLAAAALFIIMLSAIPAWVQDAHREAYEMHERLARVSQAGDYAAATSLAHALVEFTGRMFGTDSPEVADALNSLGTLYRATADYAKAEPLHRRAVLMTEKALGPEHPAVAVSLSNLAELYRALGLSATAEPLYRRALAIYEGALGTDHPAVATSLNNLALLYAARNDYTKAEPLHRRALRIREKALGPEHPDVAVSLGNLAALYRARGEYAQSEALQRRALDIRHKAFGWEHPAVATSLHGLALLYQAMGEYAKAEPLHRQALDIRENTLGPEHPDVAMSLGHLAALEAAEQNYQNAVHLYARALAARERQIQSIAMFVSAPQMLAFIDALSGDYYGFLSVIRQHFMHDQVALREAFEAALRHTHFMSDAQSRADDFLTGQPSDVAPEWVRRAALSPWKRLLCEGTTATHHHDGKTRERSPPKCRPRGDRPGPRLRLFESGHSRLPALPRIRID